jgi:hypothetical protein
MIEYIVCLSDKLVGLVQEVNKAIKVGWEPIGGVMAIRSDQYSYTKFYQAMIKEDRKLFAKKLKAHRSRGLTLDEAIANTMDEALEEANAEEN